MIVFLIAYITTIVIPMVTNPNTINALNQIIRYLQTLPH